MAAQLRWEPASNRVALLAGSTGSLTAEMREAEKSEEARRRDKKTGSGGELMPRRTITHLLSDFHLGGLRCQLFDGSKIQLLL